MARRDPSAHALGGLREVLTGAVLRTIAGVRDAGEAFLARVRNADGGPHVNTTDPHASGNDRDAWIYVVDELDGQQTVARQFIPGNILFSRPVVGDTCMVLRPRDLDGPGVSYLLWGDGGDAQRWAPWYATADGIYTPRQLRVHSRGGDVVIEPGAEHKVLLGDDGATKGVAREGDEADAGTLSAAVGASPVSFTWTPPGGGPPVTATTIHLVAKITGHSVTIFAKD